MIHLKEYSSLQENPYSVRYIHNVLSINICFAPHGSGQCLKQYIKLLQCTCTWPHITGPAAGLISYVSSQWFHFTHMGNVFNVNPFYNGVLYSLRQKGLRVLGWQKTTNLD